MTNDHDADIVFDGDEFDFDDMVEGLGPTFTGTVRAPDGDIVYIKDGHYHREDGPAVVSSTNDVIKWWLNNKPLEFEEWLNAIDADEVTKTYYRIVYG